MRFFELDGKRYEVDGCCNCAFSDAEWSICAHPEGQEGHADFNEGRYGNLCPLREVEHNMPPQPPWMRPMFSKASRAEYINTFCRAHERSGRTTIPFVPMPLKTIEEISGKLAEYFGVLVESINEPNFEYSHFWQVTFIVPHDWSPEKVGSPDLIPFVPQPEAR